MQCFKLNTDHVLSYLFTSVYITWLRCSLWFNVTLWVSHIVLHHTLLLKREPLLLRLCRVWSLINHYANIFTVQCLWSVVCVVLNNFRCLGSWNYQMVAFKLQNNNVTGGIWQRWWQTLVCWLVWLPWRWTVWTPCSSHQRPITSSTRDCASSCRWSDRTWSKTISDVHNGRFTIWKLSKSHILLPL